MNEDLFVFVLMPFHPRFEDTYQLGIKQACKDLNIYCERVDEQYYDGSIMERIYNQIKKSDYIVADMSGKNENVFFEAGYAVALKKKIIFLISKNEDIPFDLKHYPHIIYNDSILTLKEQLTNKLSWFISHPDNVKTPSTNELEFYINNIRIKDGVTINEYIDLRSEYYTLQLDTFNPTNKLIEVKVKIAFETEIIFTSGVIYDDVFAVFQNDKLLHIKKTNFLQIFPKLYERTSFYFQYKEEVLVKSEDGQIVPKPEPDRIFNFKLITYTEIEINEIKFKIKFNPKNSK